MPEPAGRSDTVGMEGNASTSLWFNDTCHQLSILATSRVETLCTNPFQFIITSPAASRVPAVYPDETRQFLKPYLQRVDRSDKPAALVAEAIKETEGQTVPFLCSLARIISGRFEKLVRKTGPPLLPLVTLEQGRGACRDLTVLFMDLCRSVGLASRFVSGYTGFAEKGVKRELHAWAEVYLPGGGWRGFDPTLGLAVADGHVAAAAGSAPAGALPIFGTYRGDAAGSMMNYEVSVVTDAAEQNFESRGPESSEDPGCLHSQA